MSERKYRGISSKVNIISRFIAISERNNATQKGVLVILE